MPCMGPSPPDKETVNKAYEDVRKLLGEKYDVLSHPLPPGDRLWHKHREEVETKLKAAIYEAFLQDGFESF